MNNNILFIVTIISSFILVIIAYRYYGKDGLFAWISFATVVSNIEVVKCVDIIGLPVTLGNVLYGSIFLATDILSENHGGKESRRGVRIGFISQLSFIVLMRFSLMFKPNQSDFASEHMQVIFSLVPRICIVSIISYYISNMLDTYLFEWIKKRSGHLWLRNNIATATCQLLDSVIFTLGAFIGVFPLSEIVLLILTTYAIKIIVAILDTPFLYWAKRIAKKNRIEREEL